MGLGIAIAVNGSVDKDLSQAVSVDVEQRAGAATQYKIHFDLDVNSGDFPLLTDSRIGPGSELAVIVPIDGKNNYLVKGPVTGQQVHFEHAGGASYLEVQGTDNSIKMDRESKAAVWSDVTDSDAVSSILGNYNLTPDVDSTQASHPETKHALIQRDTDLRFVRRLARRNGFLFWITCDEQGNETAHFKSPPVSDSSATDLIINLANNTIESFDLSWEVERPSSVSARQLNLNDKSDIDGDAAKSSLNLLGSQGLADIATDTHSVHLAIPVDDSGDLQARGQGALMESGWFVRATCRTSVDTLKKILAPQTIVNVRGLGTRLSGKFLVAAVRHTIDATAHAMDIELVRNAWGN